MNKHNSSMLSASQQQARRTLLIGTAWVLIALLISGIAPYDRATWWMEVMPALLIFPLLWWTRDRFTWTGLLYALMTLHALVLILGGAYTYARVPLGFWLQEALHLGRNPYDKIGHFMQGFVPAMAMREWVLRRAWVNDTRAAGIFAVCFAMAVSAIYELIEWLAAVLLGQGADEFLGTQGDVWDTQSDMAFALLGALVAVLLLKRWHNRHIQAMMNHNSI